jgi:hypothetical protein
LGRVIFFGAGNYLAYRFIPKPQQIMNRRLVLKHLAVASAAAMLLPSCVADPKKVSIALNNLKITGDEEALLGDLADVIIPETDTPGARAVGAHLFSLVMVDDCMTKPEQEKYLKGMRSFDETIKSITGKSFIKASVKERAELLTAFEQARDKASEETNVFYWRTRGYILQGYLSSQHFLTNVKVYHHIPGPHFKGCTPVTIEQKPVA